jgi:hypothetical protein
MVQKEFLGICAKINLFVHRSPTLLSILPFVISISYNYVHLSNSICPSIHSIRFICSSTPLSVQLFISLSDLFYILLSLIPFVHSSIFTYYLFICSTISSTHHISSFLHPSTIIPSAIYIVAIYMN